MQLADIPEEEFEAALGGENKHAEPRRILDEYKKKANPAPPPSVVPIEHTLDLWGRTRDLGQYIEAGEMPPLDLWRTNMQKFQIAHLQKYIPIIVKYLSAILEDIERERAS